MKGKKMTLKFPHFQELLPTLFYDFFTFQIVPSDVFLISDREDDPSLDTGEEEFSKCSEISDMTIEMIDRQVGDIELTPDLSPRFLLKYMQQHSLHEEHRREFFRDKSSLLTEPFDSIVVASFDEMEADEPHEA